MNRVEQMQQIQHEALELFTKKNIDYGDAFAKYGVIGVLMRIEDKLQRAMSITKKWRKFNTRRRYSRYTFGFTQLLGDGLDVVGRKNRNGSSVLYC
jgi:hypothetical protein